MRKKILEQSCSLFRTYYWTKEMRWCFNVKHPETVLFRDVLLNLKCRYHNQVELIRKVRSYPYKSEEQQTLKPQVWGITPSSIQIGGRGEKYHAMHTGFIPFDIDGLGPDLDKIREIIKQIPFIAYLAKSVSGNGLWGLIPILNTERHSEHFDAIEASFASIGIQIDTAPRNVASLRFLSYDPDAYINEDAEIYTKVKTPVQRVKRQLSGNRKNGTLDVWQNFRSNVEFDDINDILLNAGWSYHSTSGPKVRYTRPGKSTRAGISADYHTDIRTFYIFSSNAPGLEYFKEIGNERFAGSAATVLLAYECDGDKKAAYKRMRELGF